MTDTPPIEAAKPVDVVSEKGTDAVAANTAASLKGLDDVNNKPGATTAGDAAKTGSGDNLVASVENLSSDLWSDVNSWFGSSSSTASDTAVSTQNLPPNQPDTAGTLGF